VVEEGTIKLEPSESPKAINFIIKAGPDKGKTQLGIYQFDGESLKICVAKAGDTERPSSFTTKPNSENASVVMKRKTKRVPVSR
jgi:uncharacterized protein (TIGR03067 family)